MGAGMFFSRGAIVAFSRRWPKGFFQGGATAVQFHFTNSKLRKIFFY